MNVSNPHNLSEQLKQQGKFCLGHLIVIWGMLPQKVLEIVSGSVAE